MIHDVEDYTIGWISALPHELAAATGMLDERHDTPVNFEKNASDDNQYTWGRIGPHCIVLASLPSGEYGTTSAATTAAGLRSSLPHVRVGLMVGIGAGIPGPNNERDIRLGDVVVSLPKDKTGGVVQYDLAKVKDGKLQRTGHLNQPPRVLLTALAQLRAEHELEDPKVPEFLRQMLEKYPRLAKNTPGKGSYIHQGHDNDRLFRADYSHQQGSDCRHCLKNGEVERDQRDSTDPEIHYGVIASGNLLVKDAVRRDEILASLDEECICFEMEAAGLMNSFPCLVIRGICDYADSHKNDRWQKYAAATAAAFAKELLGHMDSVAVQRTPKLVETLNAALNEVTQSVDKTRAAVDDLSSSRRRAELFKWLSAADPTSDFQAAWRLHYEGTGTWFLASPIFDKFLKRESTFLWLTGLAGCGKTVLSSSVIHCLKTQSSSEGSALAFFYFTFRDTNKQVLEQAVRSLISQLAEDSDVALQKVALLYDELRSRQASLEQLEDLLNDIINGLNHVRVVLDALDESGAKIETIKWIRQIMERCEGRLQMIVTSRDEEEIRSTLDRWISKESIITLQQREVDADIGLYVRATLMNDDRFERWRNRREVQKMIEEKLTNRAGGMFRWAALQLNTLADCYNLAAVKHALAHLPKDLNATYSRMLSLIPEIHLNDAIRLLQLVLGARRPMSLFEVVEALAISLDPPYSFENDNKIPQPMEILRICPNLVRVNSAPGSGPAEESLETGDVESSTAKNDWSKVLLSLAHFSVREFLLSKDIDETFQAKFQRPRMETQMAISCIVYLEYVPKDVLRDMSGNFSGPLHNTYPFANYCMAFWTAHVLEVEKTNEEVCSMAAAFLTRDLDRARCSVSSGNYRRNTINDSESTVPGFQSAIEIALSRFMMQTACAIARMISFEGGGAQALEYVCRFGIYDVAQALLERATQDGKKFIYDRALLDACENGNEQIAILLLQAGANVNGQDGAALYSACLGGKESIVDLLLDNNADVNAGEGKALLAACGGSHGGIVRKLLSHGADASGYKSNVASRSGERPWHSLPLHLCCVNGKRKIIDILLEHKADVYATCTFGELHGITPLHMVCEQNQYGLAVALLDHGADVIAEDARGVSALCIALRKGSVVLVKRLLGAGAQAHGLSIKSQNSLHYLYSIDTALEWGNRELLEHQDHDNLIRLLLHAGADLSQCGDEGKMPIHAAAETCLHNGKVVGSLLALGAAVDERDANGRTPLHYAAGYCSVPYRTYQHAISSRSRCAAVCALLSAGADVLVEANDGTTALHWALALRNLDIIELLLSAGASPMLRTSDGTMALHDAASTGHDRLVNLLVHAGAENVVDEFDRWALHAALTLSHTSGKSAKVVQTLIEAGADSFVFDRRGRTPLHLAALGGHHGAVEVLLREGSARSMIRQADANGKTPLDLVQGLTLEELRCNHIKILKLLSVAQVQGSEGEGVDWSEIRSLNSPFFNRPLEQEATDRLETAASKMYIRNKPSWFGETLLHVIAFMGPWWMSRSFSDPKMERSLIESCIELGADVDFEDHLGRTPLHLAAISGSSGRTTILLENGADVFARDVAGKTPLQYAKAEVAPMDEELSSMWDRPVKEMEDMVKVLEEYAGVERAKKRVRVE